MKFENKPNIEYGCKEITAMESEMYYDEYSPVSDVKEVIHYHPNSCWNRFKSCVRSTWATKLTDDTSSDKQLYIRRTLRELIIYMFFLIILMIIAFGIITEDEFYFTRLMLNLFTTTQFLDKSGTFASASTERCVWNFLSGPLLSGLYWSTLYNKRNVDKYETNFLHYENKLIGLPRMRQFRVGNQTCLIPKDFQSIITECFAPFSPSSESTGVFKGVKKQIWTYTNESVLKAGTYNGDLATYGGGGYNVYLGNTYEESAAIIKTLYDELWIDRGTRAVIVDFTVYNVNINLFCIIKLGIEFSPIGGVVTSSELRTVKLIRYAHLTDYIILACEIVLVVFILYYTIEEVLEIRMVRFEYFYSVWNILDIVVIVFCASTSLLNAYRTIKVNLIVEDLITNNYRHSDLDSLSYWQLNFNYLTAITLFLAWIKTFKYISFNKTMTHLSSTLSQCSTDLSGFAIMFGIIFVAFANLGCMIFGSQVTDYRDLETSIYACFRIILGDFNFDQLEMAHRILGPFYFISYVFIIFFLLLNMFIAIVCDSHSNVKRQSEKQKNEFEISDYIKEKTDLMLAKLNLKKKRIIDLQETMETADINNDGVMDFEEFKADLIAKGYSSNEVEAFFASHDTDGDRGLDMAEQASFIKDLEAKKVAIDEEILLEISENTKKKVYEPIVSFEHYRALNKRVEAMDNQSRKIIFKLDSAIRKLKNFENSRTNNKETTQNSLKSLKMDDDNYKEKGSQQTEEITKLNH